MKKLRVNFLEATLAVLISLSLLGLCFYFYSLINPDTIENNPFKTFDNNSGIINISIATFTARIIFVICFLLLAIEKFKPNPKILTVYIFSALTIGFLQWYELYYGSTFYYGEVRDKQGITFPFLASCMLTLVIWKIDFSLIKNRNLIIKIILTGVINVGLYFLWTQVYEPWNLWQS